MGLVVVGIDEAGYGPMLGPLCVGCAAVRVEGWSPGSPPPDVWDLLAPAVARSAKEGKKTGGVAFADSKELKLPNDSARRHPLLHLEKGVLTALKLRGAAPADDGELFEALGARMPAMVWYAGAPAALPVAHSAEGIAISANLVGAAMAAAGVSLIGLACEAVGEAEFNQILDEEGSKGAVTARTLGRHLRRASEWCGDEPVWVVCDRLGGRTSYARLIEDEMPGCEAEVREESDARSVYLVRTPRGEMGVTFRSEGEKAQLSVALASMTAKYVRELAMARFNRYWRTIMPDLKPTAGYVEDARRWLRDADQISAHERRVLIRRA